MKISKSYMLLLALLSLGVIGFVSCSGGNATFNKVEVTPDNVTVATGSQTSQKFTARETLDDNSMILDMSNLVSWTSSNPNFAVDATGNVTWGASYSGTTTITATDPVKRTVTDSTTFTVADPQSISITPANPFMAINTQRQLTATASFAGTTTTQDLTSSSNMTWSPAATVNSTGYVSAGAAPDTVTIEASYTYAGSPGQATLTITATPLQKLEINQASPQDLSLTAIPPTLSFSVTGTDQDNVTTHVYTTSVIWSSSDTTVATIDSAGLATALKLGTTIITATDPITGIASVAGVTLNVIP